MAISTSGDSRQHVVIDGRRYSHLIDPRSGLGIPGRSSVSVIAPRGILADSLASAVSILGPQDGLKLVEEFRGAVLLMVSEAADGELSTTQSPGFEAFEAAVPEELP
jgi:FAD:protein FMN transferase